MKRRLALLLCAIFAAAISPAAIRAAPKGALRVHSRTMFGLGVLPPLIAEFRRQYPDIRVELTLSETKVDLRREQIDIDFRISPPVEAGLKRRILFKSERHLVASPDYVAQMPRLESPADIADHQCLAYLLPGSHYVWRFMGPAGTEEVSFNPRHVTNDAQILLDFARLGEGIALLDDYTVARHLASGALVRLLPDYQVTNTTFEEGMFATIVDTAMIPAKIRLFLDFVADRVAGRSLRFSAYRLNAGAPAPGTAQPGTAQPGAERTAMAQTGIEKTATAQPAIRQTGAGKPR